MAALYIVAAPGVDHEWSSFFLRARCGERKGSHSTVSQKKNKRLLTIYTWVTDTKNLNVFIIINCMLGSLDSRG